MQILSLSILLTHQILKEEVFVDQQRYFLCLQSKNQMQEGQQFDLIFIRHAESGTNKATQQFVKRTNIPYDWEHLSANHEFISTVKYSLKLLDAPITQEGLLQCKQAKQNLEGYRPDVILVSPLKRALMTCNEIFKEYSCPVIVEPLLAEGLRSSCDFSSELEVKKAQYPGYDFSKVERLGTFWVFSNESEENQTKYRQIVEANKEKSFVETMELIFEYMKKTFIYETATNLRRRASNVKTLLREYRKQYTSIAVVTHYNIIRFSLATEFNERDEPFHSHIDNCEIKKVLVDDL